MDILIIEHHIIIWAAELSSLPFVFMGISSVAYYSTNSHIFLEISINKNTFY